MKDEGSGPRTPGGPSPEHAQWVRSHPTVGPSAFPEYPDDEARRGSSRGALPNGNPWRPESPDDVPGAPPSREGIEGVDAEQETASDRAMTEAGGRAIGVAPVTGPTPVSSAVREATSALARDPQLARRAIEVLREGPGVVLRGRVASPEERERAVGIVASVPDVAWVEDCLEVR